MTFNDRVWGDKTVSQNTGLWEPGSVQPLHRWTTLPLSPPPLPTHPLKGCQSRDDVFQHFLAVSVLWRRAALCGSLHVFPPRTLKATVWGIYVHPV